MINLNPKSNDAIFILNIKHRSQATNTNITYFLDRYPGANVALSTRKLRSDFNDYLVKVNKGDLPVEFGFNDDNLLDIDAIHRWGSINGIRNVRLNEWRDQSLFGRNATQSTVSLQPFVQMVNGSTLEGYPINNKPSIRYKLGGATFLAPTTPTYTIFGVMKMLSGHNIIDMGVVLGQTSPSFKSGTHFIRHNNESYIYCHTRSLEGFYGLLNKVSTANIYNKLIFCQYLSPSWFGVKITDGSQNALKEIELIGATTYGNYASATWQSAKSINGGSYSADILWQELIVYPGYLPNWDTMLNELASYWFSDG